MTWKNTGAERLFGGRPFYYADIRVDPEYPDRIYSLWSWSAFPTTAARPGACSSRGPPSIRITMRCGSIPKTAISSLRGMTVGMGMSTDRGKTWRFVNNLPVGQFYHIAVDMDQPYHVYGGMQDNGSWRGPAYVWESGGIRNHLWDEVDFGDGFDTRPHPGDSMRGFAMSQEGYLTRWDLRTGERRSVRPSAEPGDTLRFNWNAGLALDPFDPEGVYYGSQYLHRSGDGGETWTRLSGDLTSDNPAWQRQRKSGGLTPDVSGAENYTTIIAIAPSPVDRKVVWAGTDDGRVQVTQDGGGTWTSVEGGARGVPRAHGCRTSRPPPTTEGPPSWCSTTIAGPICESYAFRVSDHGRRWTSLVTADIRGYCLSIVQDPVDPQLLFLGTEFGLFVSQDGGRSWMQFKHGIPTCSVMDLVIHPREHDLVIGTHGRSAYILDDIRPLRSMNDETAAKKIHLFDVPPAQQYTEKQTAGSRFPGATEYRGENRSYGAMITFWLDDPSLPHPDDKVERERKQREREEKAAKAGTEAAEAESASSSSDAAEAEGKAKGPEVPKIQLTLRDASGKKVRGFERPVYRGVGRVMWDLHSDPFKTPPRRASWWDEEPTGPEVLPGEYEVTLKYKDAETRGRITVVADPRAQIGEDARQAAWDAKQRAGSLVETITEALERLDATRKDVDFLNGKIKKIQADKKETLEDREREQPPATAPGGAPAAKDSLDLLLEEGQKLEKRAKALEGRVREPRDAKGFGKEIYILSEVQEVGDFLASTNERPSPTVLAYLERAERMVASFLTDLNRFYEEDVPAYRSRVHAMDIPILRVDPPLELTK